MRHFVALSGGKDSTAMALRLKEISPAINFEFFCTPTGDELPEMLEHWALLEKRLSSKLINMPCNDSLETLIDHFKMLPNNRARWCTRLLKIEPCLEYFAQITEQISLYIGLRADEDGRNGGVYDELPHVSRIFPLRDWCWGIDDVYEYLRKKRIEIPQRTDCARCYHQRLSDWWLLWKKHPGIFENAIKDEQAISAHRNKQVTFRNATRDTWPAPLFELRKEFESGRIPVNAQQNLELFADDRCRVCSL